MKTFAIILSILGLSILGYMIIKGGNADTTQSAIYMHPSNFDKAPIEQVEQMKESLDADIPKLEELQKELNQEGKN
ncbi:MAG: hypothetical protein ABJE80_03240 [Reichenbachiella sp.]|uniref:hypothetical protein n=1 Tax=Reichenbachiella sp. TaxID=2184521 RepID=UPI003264024A